VSGDAERGSPLSGQVDPAGRLAQLLHGYQITQLLYVFAALGVADQLAGGPSNSAQLAQAVGADPATFDRLLDPWRLLGILERGQDGRYQLTAMGALLRSDIAGSLRPAAVSYGQPWWWRPWGNLLESVRTGRTAFDEVFHEPLFPFLARNPDAAAVFNANMTAMSAADAATLAEAFGLDDVTTVVDVGGGHGVLGRAILDRYPPISVVVFDRPDVVAGAPYPAGAAEVGQLRGTAGDFFTDSPPTADAYILKDILHDWTDEQCRTILRSTRRAAPPHARLLIVERVIDPDHSDLGSALVDITMLVLTGGQERTTSQYAALLTASGWQLAERNTTATTHTVLSARPF
jgi:hypothetical protein